MESRSTVLISIHPEHAQKIISGEKRLEFRRVWTKQKIRTVILYVTAPVKKIVGMATVQEVHHGSIASLWERAQSIGGGLTRDRLYDYFSGKKDGFAVELKTVTRFVTPISPKDFLPGFSAPQSFVFVTDDILSSLKMELDKQYAKKPGRLIFIGGVHGVGKTSLCQKYAEAHGALHRSAGQLILEAKKLGSTETTKLVENIDENQRLLLEGISRIKAKGKVLLLDGHFAVFGPDSVPMSIETDVFEQLGIDAIVLLVDTPKQIAQRLSARDLGKTKIKSISALQQLELSRAHEVASALCLPFIKLDFKNAEQFDSIISQLLAQQSSSPKNASD